MPTQLRQYQFESTKPVLDFTKVNTMAVCAAPNTQRLTCAGSEPTLTKLRGLLGDTQIAWEGI
jgi:hypothetical protein